MNHCRKFMPTDGCPPVLPPPEPGLFLPGAPDNPGWLQMRRICDTAGA